MRPTLIEVGTGDRPVANVAPNSPTVASNTRPNYKVSNKVSDTVVAVYGTEYSTRDLDPSYTPPIVARTTGAYNNGGTPKTRSRRTYTTKGN